MSGLKKTYVEVKCRGLSGRALKALIEQNYVLKYLRTNDFVIRIGEVDENFSEFVLPPEVSVHKSCIADLVLCEQSTFETYVQAIVYCTANGAPLKPFWIDNNVISSKGTDALFAVGKAVFEVFYDSATKKVEVAEVTLSRHENTIFVKRETVWLGKVEILQNVCPVCGCILGSCRNYDLCREYKNFPVPSKVSLPPFIDVCHNAVLHAILKTSGVVYPLFINPPKGFKGRFKRLLNPKRVKA